MADTIRFKRGTAAPGSLSTGEPAVDITNDDLYFGATGGVKKALTASKNLSDVANSSTARTNLGLAIGINVQAYNANLANVRTVLTADQTYYVRTDGSNSNTGLVNNSGGAFLTIQKAIDTAYTLDWSTYRVTIQLQDATWSETPTTGGRFLSKQSLLILGNTTTPANVILTCAVNGFGVTAGAFVEFSGVTFNPSQFASLYTEAGGKAVIGSNCRFSGSASEGQLLALEGGIIQLTHAYSIVAGGGSHWKVREGGVIDTQNSFTITITGTPAFSNAFAVGLSGGNIVAASKTYSGSATGKRYDVTLNAVVNTFGAGATALPGNASGTTATGGQYA